MTRSLDDIDQQLLAGLRSDARVSLADLAQRVHLSRNAVRQRVDRLERDGHILGYTIVEGSSTRAPVTAMLLIDRTDRLRGGDVLDALQRLPEVVHCDIVSGELDVVARVEAADAERIKEIWQELAQLPGVRDITTAWSLSSVVQHS